MGKLLFMDIMISICYRFSNLKTAKVHKCVNDEQHLSGVSDVELIGVMMLKEL